MRCPLLAELPAPPPGAYGWPWTAESARATGSFPRLTIVTPSFNQGRFLEETIRSVLLQGYPDLEYFIIDGGSTDGTLDILRKYDRWLSAWITEPDHGQSDAINKGWHRATGAIVAYLNSDDTYRPDALTAVAAAFAADPAAGLVYGDCYVIDAQGIRQRQRRVGTVRLAELLAWSPSLPQPGLFVRRAVLAQVGPLDPELHYTMDYDLCVRVALAAPFRYLPRFLANMRGHPDAKTARHPERHVEEGLRVATRFFQRQLPPPIAALRNQTLARLEIRLARVHAWLNHRREAAQHLAAALRLSRHPSVVAKVIVAFAMSLLGRWLPLLRRLKQACLRTLTPQ